MLVSGLYGRILMSLVSPSSANCYQMLWTAAIAYRVTPRELLAMQTYNVKSYGQNHHGQIPTEFL